jgi:ATP-dependent DNA ligase
MPFGPTARAVRPFRLIFEPFDGFLAVAYVEDGAARLVSRNRTSTSRPGAHGRDRALLRVDSPMLDGEIVCIDGNGAPQFHDPWTGSRPFGMK